MNKKGLTGIAKISFFLILLITLGFFVYNIIPALAEGSATIWTTDVYGNPKLDFEPYTTVYIHGSNFLKHRKIYVSVTRPDSVVEKGFTFSDYSGNFVYEYQLNAIEGLYNVLASDKVNTAQTVFTDASIHFTQCANDDNNNDVKDDCDWVPGSLNQNNAIYTEGDVVPHRLFHKIADAGTHTIRLRYQFTKGDEYAYDFISTPDLTQSGPDFNPCGQLPGWISSGVCSSLYSGALSPSVPSDSFDAVSSRENPASRTIFIGGVSSPSVSIVGHDPSTSCFQNCGDSDVYIDVTFTTSSSDTIVAVWFGGHLAQAADPDNAGPLLGWGDGYGASSISGAPFHVSYISLDGDSVGKRDNQIQPGAVIIPPECITNEDCDDGNPCITDECIDNTCVYTPEPLSTSCELDDDLCTLDHCNGEGSCVNYDDVYVPPAEECVSYYCDSNDGIVYPIYEDYSIVCEADGDLCTHDHCDGAGLCVWNYDEPVPDPEECRDFYCDPSDGQIKANNYELSTFCELDDDLCTLDHCNGEGSCVNYDDVYVPPAEECLSYYCDPNDGLVKENYYDYSTSCNNELYCDGPDHCDGFGSCVNLGPSIDCSHLDNDCQEGVCDEDLDDCIPDYYDYSTSCELDDNLCTIDHCNGSGSCVTYDNVFVPDPEQCNSFYCDPSDGQVKEDYSNYPLSTTCEADSDLCTHDHCDGAGQCVLDYNEPVPPAEECKSFYCDPNDGQVKEDYTNYPESTFCELDDDLCTLDHCNGEGSCVNYDDVYVPPAEECVSYYCDSNDGIVKEDYTDYPWSTFCELDDDVCTVDHCDGLGSCVNHYNISAPSMVNKTVGEPKAECQEEDWCDYTIATVTPITLSCEDGDVKWRYALNGDWKEWNTNTSPVTVYFPENCNHTLEARCVGVCGESDSDIENFKVRGTKFEIPLYFKWNLISVPFVLLNDDPADVFKDLEGVESVWSYHDDEWFVYTPGPAPDTLDSIEPGWGYWILETEDEELLIVGGALFDEGPVLPPGRPLVEGWNLIGYYGTSWELYNLSDANFKCGDISKFLDKYIYGDKVYCSLNSLVNTQEGYPKWSSLWSYLNCGNYETYWIGLNTCADPEDPIQTKLDRMYAGRGYWLEIDEDEFYAPASTCLWNSGFACRWTGGGVFP